MKVNIRQQYFLLMKAENNKYEELWSKIKDIIRAISNCLHISKLNRFCNNKLNNSNNYDE